jgi:hypothetical protein
MEAPRNTLRSVHVLRHTFQPSEPLAERLEAFVNPESRVTRPRFLLESTYQVAVDSIDYMDHRFDEEVLNLQAMFTRRAGSVALGAVGYRYSDTGAFSMRFSARDPSRFRTVVTPLDTVSDAIERSDRNVDPHLTMHIGHGYLADQTDLKRAWDSLRKDLRNDTEESLLFVTPHKISALQKNVYLPVTETLPDQVA